MKPEHIKDRLLGHWGNSPGINLIYAHLNQLILRYYLDMFLVTGPGHGAPANLSNIYLEGTTTTPFDMNVRNGTSRYHLIMQAIRLAAARNPRVAARASSQVSHYEYVLAAHRRYIEANGVDPEEITNWKWHE